MQTTKKRLYFIAGYVATEAEAAEAQALGFTSMRNTSKLGSLLEKADEVAGCYPDAYKNMRGCRIIDPKKIAK